MGAEGTRQIRLDFITGTRLPVCWRSSCRSEVSQQALYLTAPVAVAQKDSLKRGDLRATRLPGGRSRSSIWEYTTHSPRIRHQRCICEKSEQAMQGLIESKMTRVPPQRHIERENSLGKKAGHNAPESFWSMTGKVSGRWNWDTSCSRRYGASDYCS